MNRYLKELLILLIIVSLFIVGKSIFNTWKDNRLVRETTLRTESEMRFKQLAKELVVLKGNKDSLTAINLALDSIIEVQKNHPRIIIRKVYEKHNYISSLDDTNSVILFTSNIRRYDSLQGYYNLSRFNK